MSDVIRIDLSKKDLTKVDLSTIVSQAKLVLASGLFDIERTSKISYLSGPRPERLGVVTGALRAGIKTEVQSTSKKLSGQIGFGPQVWYGQLHEEGIGGHKKRAFLVPAIEEHIESISDQILESINKALKGI